MTSAFQLHTNERLLLQIQANLQRVVATTGTLILTDRRLRFQPANDVERKAGARDDEILIEDVVEANLSLLRKSLQVETVHGSFRFSGADVLKLGARLVTQLPGCQDFGGSFQQQGRELLTGQLWWKNGWKPVYGRFVLTRQTLSILPSRLNRSWAPSIEINLSKVVECYGVGSQLTMVSGSESHWLWGVDVPSLAALLDVLDVGSESPSPACVLANWPIQRGGLFVQRGQGILTEDQLRIYSGRQHSPEVVLALSTVQGIRLEQDVLILESENNPPVQMGLRTSDRQMSKLLLAILACRSPGLLMSHPEQNHGFQAMIKTWKAAIGWQDVEEMLWASPTIRHIEDEQHTGWLILSDLRVYFLPDSDTQTAKFVFPLRRILRAEWMDANPEEITLYSGDRLIRLHPQGGAAMVSAFWDRCQVPSRIIQRSIADERALQKMVQDIRFVQILGENHDINLRPGMAILQEEGGLGLILPASVEPIAEGASLTISMGQTDGVYQFDARVEDTSPLPEQVQVPRNGKMLLLSPPEELRFFNRRNAFRVGSAAKIQIRRMAWNEEESVWQVSPDQVESTLVDLSADGCCLKTDVLIAVGDRLLVDLPLGKEMVLVQAECMRIDPPWRDHQPQLGMRFVTLTRRTERMIQQTVLRKQLRL